MSTCDPTDLKTRRRRIGELTLKIRTYMKTPPQRKLSLCQRNYSFLLPATRYCDFNLQLTRQEYICRETKSPVPQMGL